MLRGSRYDFLPAIHGDWFVLVDKQARIRGYFSTTEPKELDRLTKEIGRLEQER